MGNVEADLLSRRMLISHKWELDPQTREDLFHRWGFPDMDLFATQQNKRGESDSSLRYVYTDDYFKWFKSYLRIRYICNLRIHWSRRCSSTVGPDYCSIESDNLSSGHSDVLEEWLTCQRSWLYLEPIFSSEDINRQLPVESKRYQTMERTWRKIMKNANENREVINVCPDPRLLEKLRECNKLLDLVQKGLSEYLETKRGAFPRFYFLSDDELLEILSQTKDPTAVQPHLRKCFENIAREDLQITHMYSAEGEEVKLFSPIYPTGNVEDWLLEVEKMMKASVRDNIERSIRVYPHVSVFPNHVEFI
ncbi:Dynein heavy chain 1, axonemal [Varanus komodoensis]|nr:Dynein heavy chain 1, axonemal [Varanus komodoensis]